MLLKSYITDNPNIDEGYECATEAIEKFTGTKNVININEITNRGHISYEGDTVIIKHDKTKRTYDAYSLMKDIEPPKADVPEVKEEKPVKLSDSVKRSQEELDEERDREYEPETVKYGSIQPYYEEYSKRDDWTIMRMPNGKEWKHHGDTPDKYITVEKPVLTEEIKKEWLLTDYQRKNNYMNLRKLMRFIMLNWRMRVTDETVATVISIPVTQKSYRRIFGEVKNTQRVRELALKVGLITPFDNRFRFNGKETTKKEGFMGKRYLWHHSVENEIMNMCLSMGLQPWTSHDTAELMKSHISYWDVDVPWNKVRISSHTNIAIDPEIPYMDFMHTLGLKYRQAYPQIVQNNLIMARYNELDYVRENPELRLKAEVSFKVNEDRTRVVKAGYRDWCPASSIPKKRGKKIPMRWQSRPQMLRSLGLKYENDITSSVPRHIYFLTHGEWLPQHTDIYNLLWEIMDEPDRTRMFGTSWQEARPAIKKLFMLVAFGGTDKEIAAHILRKVSLNPSIIVKEDEVLESAYTLIHLMRTAMKDLLGVTEASSEIFLHETSTTLLAMSILMDRGVKVYKCYDCLYTDRLIDMDEVMEEATSLYKSTYPWYFGTMPTSATLPATMKAHAIDLLLIASTDAPLNPFWGNDLELERVIKEITVLDNNTTTLLIQWLAWQAYCIQVGMDAGELDVPCIRKKRIKAA